MQTLKAYLYPVILQVQIPDPGIFKVRKKTVYSNPIKIYQGVDNPIQIVVQNQDNKSVDLEGSSVQVYVQDPVNQTVVADYTVEWSDINKGRGIITINAATANALEQRFYKLLVKRTNDTTGETTPAYVDANYGVPIDLEVLAGYYSAE